MLLPHDVSFSLSNGNLPCSCEKIDILIPLSTHKNTQQSFHHLSSLGNESEKYKLLEMLMSNYVLYLFLGMSFSSLLTFLVKLQFRLLYSQRNITTRTIKMMTNVNAAWREVILTF